MHKHTLGYYQEKNGGSLLPDDSSVKGILNSAWYTTLSDFFDDLIWQYYGERQIFINEKYNLEDEAATIANIKRAFAINLKSKAYKYAAMYESTQLEFNPLYNVDATEHTERTLKQEGKGDHTLSGSDTLTTSGSESTDYEGSEANTRSGNETTDYEGTEANTRSGSTDTTRDGDQVETDAKTTYDSASFNDTDQKTTEYPTETETYNDVKDERSFTDRTDTHTYNDVKDERSFKDRTDTHTYNDVQNEQEWGKVDTENRDFLDTEIIDHRRFGNIGVTRADQLIQGFRDITNYDWMKKCVQDCVNTVSYAIY